MRRVTDASWLTQGTIENAPRVKKRENYSSSFFFFCILFSPFEKHHKGVELSAVFFVWGGIYFGAVWETVWN
jgi:hypothetical protein